MQHPILRRCTSAVVTFTILLASHTNPAAGQRGAFSQSSSPDSDTSRVDATCRRMNCLFLAKEIDYYLSLDEETNVLRLFYGRPTSSGITVFYYRKADSTLWAKFSDGTTRLVGPPILDNVGNHMHRINTVYMTRTSSGKVIEQTRSFTLVNEVFSGTPEQARATSRAPRDEIVTNNGSGAGLAAILLGLGVLWGASEAAKARDKADQEECMRSCKLSRARCVELCTQE